MVTDAEILALEERMPAWSAAKANELTTLGIRPARYFQRLRLIVTRKDVIAAHPQMAARLMRKSIEAARLHPRLHP